MEQLSDLQQKGIDSTCETVTIETEAGPVRINAHEFDPKKHKLAGEAKATVEKSKK